MVQTLKSYLLSSKSPFFKEKNVKTKVTSEKIKSNAVPQLLDDLRQELKEIKEDIKRIYENQEKGMK